MLGLTKDTMEMTLQRLLSIGETGRTKRAGSRPCQTVKFTGSMWSGECQGREVWRPRIVVEGRTTFGCTCPDHAKQRGVVGPCKHVISLARTALSGVPGS